VYGAVDRPGRRAEGDGVGAVHRPMLPDDPR
jgi:hypothetical protein